MKIIILLSLILLSTSIQAQNIDIAGVLSDSITKTNLPYGNVLLMNDQDSIITGALTNEKGEFKLKNISYFKGMYLITKYLNYNDKKIPFEIIKNNFVYIGQIKISQKVTILNEVEVLGNIKPIEKKFDRRVYNINQNKLSSARSILDLLRPLPGVVVDDNGQVFYKGAEAVIYVDDQPLIFLYPKIEMIPVDKVDKVELIDAAMLSGGDGRGGIINIKFKTLNTDGLSGIFTINTNTISFESLDKSRAFINLNYKIKKITLFFNSSLDINFGNINFFVKNDINAFQNTIFQNSNSIEKFNRNTNFNNTGIVYMPSKNTKFYLSCGFYTLDYSSLFNELFVENNKSNQAIINTYKCYENSNSNQLYKGINISYWHKFDTLDTYIKMFGSLNSYKLLSKDKACYQYNVINYYDVDSLFKYYNDKKYYNNSMNVNILYNHSISKNTRWSLSYIFSFALKDTTTNKHYVNDDFELANSQFDGNINQNHNFSIRIGTNVKKWKLDGGANLKDYFVRGSYQRYMTNSEDTIIGINKNYFKILPSFTIGFNFNETNEMKLTLSQTSNFPNFRKLSDYIDKRELYLWNSGNSKLKPVDFYSTYLGYNYSKEKCNVTAEVFFNYTNNEIIDISIPITSQLNLTKPENLAKKSNTGIDLSIWYKINNHFNYSLSSSIFHVFYDARSLKNTAIFYNLSSENLIKKQFGYNIKFNFEYNFKKIYTMFFVNYNAKQVTYNGYNKAWINSSFNISRKFFNNRLRISTGVNNILNNLVEHGTYSDNFGINKDSKITGSDYDPSFLFSLQYNFKQGDRGTKDIK